MLATPMASTSSLYWQSLSQSLQTCTVNYSPYFGFSDEFLLWCFTVLSNSGCLKAEFFTPPVVVLLVAQSCPTLGDPMDCSLPGFPVHEILQSRILEWVVISSSGDLPTPGIEPRSPALQVDSLPCEPPGKPSLHLHNTLKTKQTKSFPPPALSQTI